MRPNRNSHFDADTALIPESRDFSHSLAAQVSDIAQRISRLHQIVGNGQDGQPPVVDAAMLRRVLMARRARARFFPAGLFSDPAWDILLDLLQAKLDGQRVTISNLCAAANVPATTGLRWIKTLEEAGLLGRRADPLDGRRIFIELTEQADVALKDYFSSIGLEFSF